VTTGIRITELRLAGVSGTGKTYSTGFRAKAGGTFRPLSVIAGPSLTGKTSIIDFIKYCLGDDEHPQHAEVLAAVRAALLETELDGDPTVIERAASGDPSKFASIWHGTRLSNINGSAELRVSTEPPSDPDGLSQFVLAACNLDGIELPDSAVNPDTATQLLSIRDVFRVMFVPNDRLDNKNLVFENSHHMVKQKFRQTIDAMFGVHNNEQAVLAGRLRLAREAARAAELSANTLRRIADDEHPRGALVLASDLTEAAALVDRLEAELVILDDERRTTEQASHALRTTLVAAQMAASAARVRTRDRRSLIDRLDALRGQYADDKRKLHFLLDAQRLFDPLQVVTCPACFSDLGEAPSVTDGACSLCHTPIEGPTEKAAEGEQTAESGATPLDPNTVLAAELRAVSKRLKSLNDYVARLDAHLRVLVDESIEADASAVAAAQAVDDITASPAPWLALRNGVSRRITQARLALQSAEAGVRAWDRVAEADANHERLVLNARRINAEARQMKQTADRGAVISALSARFGEILAAIGYPKLANPYIGDDLIPHVRDLPYTSASSGGMVLISLAWNLALWQVAHEQGANSPGLLVIDSPQKNLGHNSKAGDKDFADAALVENFYAHAKKWLASDGSGAQLIVVDNTPPSSVDDDIVCRFTRLSDVPPYGLIPEATD
jgi:hypothetical protein